MVGWVGATTPEVCLVVANEDDDVEGALKNDEGAEDGDQAGWPA